MNAPGTLKRGPQYVHMDTARRMAERGDPDGMTLAEFREMLAARAGYPPIGTGGCG